MHAINKTEGAVSRNSINSLLISDISKHKSLPPTAITPSSTTITIRKNVSFRKILSSVDYVMNDMKLLQARISTKKPNIQTWSLPLGLSVVKLWLHMQIAESVEKPPSRST